MYVEVSRYPSFYFHQLVFRPDFADTADMFLATALQVQNLLAEITPTSVPDDELSIPGIFNEWLFNLIGTYPTGCT